MEFFCYAYAIFEKQKMPEAPPSPESEVVVETHELTREDFADTAEGIFNVFTFAESRGFTRREIYRDLTELYVKEADDPRLAAFASLLVGAEVGAHRQRRLTALREKGERRSERFRSYKDRATDYNHLLREVIAAQPRYFSREQLSTWLEQASQDSEWTESQMKGAIAEVAVAERLSEVPGVRSVRYSTLAEEPKGIDVVATLDDGKECRMDVKFGENSTVMDVEPTTSGVAVQVDPAELAGFEIAPAARETVTRRLGRAVSYCARNR